MISRSFYFYFIGGGGEERRKMKKCFIVSVMKTLQKKRNEEYFLRLNLIQASLFVVASCVELNKSQIKEGREYK